jgi:hypothetical protein
LPVGARGISSTTITSTGRLYGATRSASHAAIAAGETPRSSAAAGPSAAPIRATAARASSA